MDFRIVFQFMMPFIVIPVCSFFMGSGSLVLLRDSPGNFLFQNGLLLLSLLFSLQYSFPKKVLILLPIPRIRLARTIWFMYAILTFLFFVVPYGLGTLVGWYFVPDLIIPDIPQILLHRSVPFLAMMFLLFQIYLLVNLAGLGLVRGFNQLTALQGSIHAVWIVLFAWKFTWLEIMFGNWMWTLVFLTLVAALTYCLFMDSWERLQIHWLQPMQAGGTPAAGKPDRITHPVWRSIRTSPLRYACLRAWVLSLVFAGQLAFFLLVVNRDPKSPFREVLLIGPMGVFLVSFFAYQFALPYLSSLRNYAVLPLSRGRLIRNCLLLPFRLVTPYFLIMALVTWVLSLSPRLIVEPHFGYYFSLYVLALGINLLAYALGMIFNPRVGLMTLFVALSLVFLGGIMLQILYGFPWRTSNGVLLGFILIVLSGLLLWEILSTKKKPFSHNYERVCQQWSGPEGER